MPNELADPAAQNFRPGAPRSLHSSPAPSSAQPKASASKMTTGWKTALALFGVAPKTSVSIRKTPMPAATPTAATSATRHPLRKCRRVNAHSRSKCQPASAPATTYKT